MKKSIVRFSFLSLIIITAALWSFCVDAQEAKIVGLIQVRNEEEVIEQCLRGLAVYTDAIVVLDDNSRDNTLAIVSRLADALSIEKIIAQPYSGWQKTSEMSNRQALLDAGREIGGTHFVLIDADELFMAPCAEQNWLRNKILLLETGQTLSFPTANVWGSAYAYRDDSFLSPYRGYWKAVPMIFCDDGNAGYQNATKMLHGLRIPQNLKCKKGVPRNLVISDLNYGMVHFRWANLDNIYTKKLWYMMLEYTRANEYDANKEANLQHIVTYYNKREFYGKMPDEKRVRLQPVPATWYNYSFFDASCYIKPNHQREKDIEEWIAHYGADYFAPLTRFFNKNIRKP